jgi:hypothetical protein
MQLVFMLKIRIFLVSDTWYGNSHAKENRELFFIYKDVFSLILVTTFTSFLLFYFEKEKEREKKEDFTLVFFLNFKL